MMEARRIQFAWGIGCCHPECNTRLEKWAEGDGPPYQDFDETEEQGWFIHADQRERDVDGYTVFYRYIAFCPKHAIEAYQWKENVAAWDKARWQVGKNTHTSLFEKFRDMTYRALGMKVGQTVGEWIVENPYPEPPWRSA